MEEWGGVKEVREETETEGAQALTLYTLPGHPSPRACANAQSALLLCALLICTKQNKKEPFSQIMTNDLPEVKEVGLNVLSNAHKG